MGVEKLDNSAVVTSSAASRTGGDSLLDRTITLSSVWNIVSQKLSAWGVETQGIQPVLPEQRAAPQFWKFLLLWLSCNMNVLSFSTGTLGPLIFELNLRDSSLVILFFNLIGCSLPGFLSIFGPKLGLRQMCQARFAFSLWGGTIPSFLNALTFMGFMVLSCIIGGEVLSTASVSFDENGTAGSGGISWNVGIVIVSLISLVICFCGYTVLSIFEHYAWIPVLIVYLIALGVSGSKLGTEYTEDLPRASHRQILGFGATINGFVIAFAGLASDYTTYMPQDVQSSKVFLSTFLGLGIPTTLVEILGAACGAALISNSSWTAAYAGSGLPGLLHQMLRPAGQQFSRFLLVILAFSVTANVTPTLYSFSLSAQTTLPFSFMRKIPRFVFPIFATAILIPLSIVGSTRFYDALTNFLGIIGYWYACFGGVILIEHFVFRRADFSKYAVEDWDRAERLPTGMAAISSCIIGLGIVVLCMDQAWWVGPVAKTTGDVGFEVGFGVSVVCYVGMRAFERGMVKR